MRSLGWLLCVTLWGCADEVETGPLPADPPEQDCATAQLTPITSVHEHIQTVARLELIKEHMRAIEVERIVLLPFLENHVEQNPAQLKAALADEQILSFVSVDTHDLDASRKIVEHINGGGAGVKLYSGHSEHASPVSMISPNAWLIYQTIDALGVPLLMHVNGGRYERELRTVLDAFPNLRVLCPHYCLLSSNIHRLHALLDAYPNLYSDVSFGSVPVALGGARTINRHHTKIRAVVRHHADRFLFGTDLPVGETRTARGNATALAPAYRDMLEKEEYSLVGTSYRGLKLDRCTLEKIYRKNADAFLARRAR